VYPTLVELAGLNLPAEVQGRSFAHLLEQPDTPEFREDAFIQADSDFCLRTKRWAYMRYTSGDTGQINTMLYDMEQDPLQFRNLSGKSEYTEVETSLQQRLDARIALAESAAITGK